MKVCELALPLDLRLAIIHRSLRACKLTFVGVPILPFENKMSCKVWAVSKSFKSQTRFVIFLPIQQLFDRRINPQKL